MQKSTTKARKASHTKKPAKTETTTKAETILKLLRRSKGASLAELAKATGWQNHSVRGFLSGTVRKRMQLDLFSEKTEDGIRRYRVVAAKASGS